MPTIGTIAADLDSSVLYLSFNQHVIYYFIVGDVVCVFAVFHKNMLPKLHLTGRMSE